MNIEYLFILFFLLLSILVGIIMFFLSYILAYKDYDSEKISAYECGFSAFAEDSRDTFDIRFYLVSILFLIFDLEIIFLFPWVTALIHLQSFGFNVMVLFLIILTLGFIYEWLKGALEW